MFVIVEIAGQQFKAEKGRKLFVHRLAGEVDSSVNKELTTFLSLELLTCNLYYYKHLT